MTYSSVVLADTPLAYYRLGDLSGTVMTDSSGNAHNGTYTGVTLASTGLLSGDSDKAATFTGSTSVHADVPYGSWMNVGTNNQTLEAIIKPTVVNVGQYMFTRDGYSNPQTFFLGVNASAKANGTWMNNSGGSITVTGATSLTAGVAYHVVLTYDGSTARLYLNGVQDGSFVTSNTLQNGNTSNGFCIGGQQEGASYFNPFNGVIDEVAFYSSTLSPTRIAAHYAAATGTSILSGAVALTATSTLTVAAFGVFGAAAALTSTSTLTAAATVTRQSAVPLTTVSTLSAAAARTVSAAAALTTTSTLTVAASVAASTSVVALTATSTLTIGGTASAPTAVIYNGTSQTGTWTVGLGQPTGTAVTELVIIDDVQTRAPTSVQIIIYNCFANEVLTISIDGVDVYTVIADVNGHVAQTSIPVFETTGLVLDAGVHTLTATGPVSTASDTFTLNGNPDANEILQGPDVDPVEIPEATATPVRRWVLQDLLPGGLGSWAMPINPTSIDWPGVSKTTTTSRATSITGTQYVTQGGYVGFPVSFTGYCPDQAFYEQLQAYAALERRIYVIDDQNRAWTIAILGADIKLRKRQRNDDGSFEDWAADYTVDCWLFRSNYATPVVAP